MTRPEKMAIASIVLPAVALVVANAVGSPGIYQWTQKIDQKVFFWLLNVFVLAPVAVGFVIAFVAFYHMSPDSDGAPYPRWASICAIIGVLFNGAVVLLGVLMASSGH